MTKLNSTLKLTGLALLSSLALSSCTKYQMVRGPVVDKRTNIPSCVTIYQSESFLGGTNVLIDIKNPRTGAVDYRFIDDGGDKTLDGIYIFVNGVQEYVSPTEVRTQNASFKHGHSAYNSMNCSVWHSFFEENKRSILRNVDQGVLRFLDGYFRQMADDVPHQNADVKWSK